MRHVDAEGGGGGGAGWRVGWHGGGGAAVWPCGPETVRARRLRGGHVGWASERTGRADGRTKRGAWASDGLCCRFAVDEPTDMPALSVDHEQSLGQDQGPVAPV